MICLKAGKRRRRIFAVVVAGLIATSSVSPASGIRNGNDETGSPLVMTFEMGCSAAVVAPHIVLAAAHCLGFDGFEPYSFTVEGELKATLGLKVFDDEKVLMHQPGVRRNNDKASIRVTHAVVPLAALDRKANQGPIFDFMALVVDQRIISDSLPIATSEQILTLKETREALFAIGYGLKSPSMANSEYLYPSSSVVKMLSNGDININGWPEYGRYGTDADFNYVLVNFPPDSGAGNGDSGSPLYAIIDGKIHYVGGMSNTFCVSATTPLDDPLRSDKTCGDFRGAGYFTAAGYPNVVELALALAPSN